MALVLTKTEGHFMRPEDWKSTSVKQALFLQYSRGSKLGLDATKKLPGEGFKRPWPPLIRMDGHVRKKLDALIGGEA